MTLSGIGDRLGGIRYVATTPETFEEKKRPFFLSHSPISLKILRQADVGALKEMR